MGRFATAALDSAVVVDVQVAAVDSAVVELHRGVVVVASEGLVGGGLDDDEITEGHDEGHDEVVVRELDEVVGGLDEVVGVLDEVQLEDHAGVVVGDRGVEVQLGVLNAVTELGVVTGDWNPLGLAVVVDLFKIQIELLGCALAVRTPVPEAVFLEDIFQNSRQNGQDSLKHSPLHNVFPILGENGVLLHFY